MESRRFPRCGVDGCKETLFYLENGQWFCKNGHLKEGELETAVDDEHLGTQGSRAGRIALEKEKIQKVLKGRKGFELYLQCYQIVLQKQVRWLIHEKKFPEELEVIVRDLWALRLDILSSKVPANNSQQKKSQEDADGSSSQSSYLYTSSDDTVARRRKRHVPKASDRPKLTTSIALCYLGLLLLKAAVCLGDLHRWIEEENGLPYVRAIKEVPPAMKDKLSAEYWKALDPGARPKRGVLYRTVQELVIIFQGRYGMTFPPINEKLLLVRYIADLGLPLEVYKATLILAEHIFLSFSWPQVIKQKRTFYWPEARLMALVIIATKLCYGLDGITRHPKTEHEAGATVLDWNAWEKFLREGNERRRGLLGEAGEGNVLNVDVKEVDVFNMSKERMDQYMDWYEKTWCGAGDTNNLSQGILNLFPTGRPEGQISKSNEAAAEEEPAPTTDVDKMANRIRELHGTSRRLPAKPLTAAEKTASEETLTAKRVTENGTEEKKIVRPGQQYLWYAIEEEIPHQLQVIMQAGADLLAIDRADLSKVLRHLETQLREDVKERRRKQRREERAGIMSRTQNSSDSALERSREVTPGTGQADVQEA